MRITISVSSETSRDGMKAGDCFGCADLILPIEEEVLFNDDGLPRDLNAFALQYLAPAFVHALQILRQTEVNTFER